MPIYAKNSNGELKPIKINVNGIQGPKGDTGPQGPTGPKGDKGEDGLTTSVKVGSQTFTQNEGLITLTGIATKEELNNEVDKINSQLNNIANKGTTVEVLERVTKEEIDRQISDGTIANLTIQDNSITPSKTTFFKEIKSKNLLNPSMIDWGTWLGNGLDGNTINKVAGANASWSSTKAIEIEPNTTYVFQKDNNYMTSSYCNYCY